MKKKKNLVQFLDCVYCGYPLPEPQVLWVVPVPSLRDALFLLSSTIKTFVCPSGKCVQYVSKLSPQHLWYGLSDYKNICFIFLKLDVGIYLKYYWEIKIKMFKEMLNEETLFMSWRSSAIKEVNDWVPNVSRYSKSKHSSCRKKKFTFFSEIMQSDILLRITLKLILQLHFFFVSAKICHSQTNTH